MKHSGPAVGEQRTRRQTSQD